MLVTIISVAFNSEKTIAKAIESVLNQTYNNIEYIIVDGASSDGTVAVANSYKDAFQKTQGKTLTVISEKDNGMYDALNKGISMAGGEIIGNINTDDWYEVDAVEKMVALYKETNYDAAWGSLNVVKSNGNFIKKAKAGKKIWLTTGWCHPAMFAKKEILLKFPYACENMYDDWDFITRVHLANKKIVTTSDIISNFTFGDGGQSTKKSFKEAMRRVKITYGIYRKHGMSRLYWFHRFAVELVKFLIG